MMVFFSSCMSVKFHHKLQSYIDLSVMCIHGKQKQTKRTAAFFQYCNSGILLWTWRPGIRSLLLIRFPSLIGCGRIIIAK